MSGRPSLERVAGRAYRLGLHVATVGPCGYAAFAPGTVGSVAGLVFYGALRWIQAGPVAELAILIALAGAGIWAAGVAEAHFGRTDPGQIVIDEVVGMLTTLALLPIGPPGVAIGFFLFRFFDVVKPYPAGRLEQRPGGWGVVGDDVVAGLYAHVTLRALVWIAPGWVA